MTRPSPILALGLCLLMALTSQSLAVARGVEQPVGQIVLCTGTGPTAVPVDRHGQPLAMPHVCPECLPGFAVLFTEPDLPLIWQRQARRADAVPTAPHRAALMRPASVARAPPVLPDL
ncbi:hypothetical protein [uncultured Roseovarius sp.]|uniref:hypothetical protein n=1 Tax=uncultured Roseovarius sp. TaxID=293344 RepID=UPI002607402A|nr:hypothetical protein [uncultured Roseovarius sp.]